MQVPLAQKIVAEVSNSARDMFPQDLVVTIVDNKWSLNKPEPFIVPAPVLDNDVDAPKNFVVLYQNGTIEDITKFDTLVLVNAKNLLVRESSGFRAYPLDNLPNGTITRADFDGFINQLLGLAKNLPYLIVIFIFAGTLLYFAVLQGSNVLTFALLVWLTSAILKKNIGYTASARITAHAATLPMIIMVIAKLLDYQMPVPFWFELLNLIFALAVLAKLAPRGGDGVEVANIEAK